MLIDSFLKVIQTELLHLVSMLQVTSIKASPKSLLTYHAYLHAYVTLSNAH